MTYTIKIKIETNNNSQSDYDKIIEKKSEGKELDSNDLSAILSTLNTVLIELKSKLKVFQFSYNIKLINASQDVITCFEDENSLFEEVAKFDSLTQQIVEYTKVTDNGAYNSRIWEDDESPLGNEAILALVAKDKKWVPEYIQFLRTCDLDHEVNQWGNIEEIIGRYNWCEETASLAIARLLSCCGQHGDEQFKEFLKGELSTFIKRNATLFIEKIITEIKYISTGRRYSSVMSEEYYLKSVFEDIGLVTQSFNEDEIEKIKQAVSETWNADNSKS